MRGRVSAVLFSLLLFPAAVLPQCDYRLDYSGQYRASVFDVVIDGSDLWTATGYGIQLFDRSVDPPQLIDSIAAPGLTRVIRASGGIAYAAGTGGIHVVRRSGKALQLVRSIALAGVNDLALSTTTLYAATTNGIVQFDLLDRSNPQKAAVPFATSSANITSIALVLSTSTLYATDGDSSVEVFSVTVPASPQKIGTINSLAAATSVNASGSRLYVSDGQRTEVFNGNAATMTKLATLALPIVQLAELSPNVIMTSGTDRTFRAVDVTNADGPITLYEHELIPSGGTVNRIAGLASAPGRLYVAAGDMGLAAYDTSRFASPYPLRAYNVGASSSIVAGDTAVYLGKSSGGIQELTRSSTGGLTAARQWGSGTYLVQDESNNLLLASSGATLTMWTLVSTTPTLVSSATFGKSIGSAALSGSKAVALLEDGTVWTADMSQNSPAPVRTAASVPSLAQVAVSDRGVAATEVRQDGTTVIHYWSGTNLDAAPINAIVSGAATSLALGGSIAAVFTFRGITAVNFGSGTTLASVLPQSNTVVVSSLRIAGDRLLAVADNELRVWNLSTGAFEKSFAIPGSPNGLDVAGSPPVAAVMTATGVVSVNYSATTSLPVAIAQRASNTYYRKAAAGATRLYLFDGRAIDVFEIVSAPAPRFVGSIPAAGIIDLAATDGGVFTLSSSAVVSSYSRDGALLASKSLDEGTDVVPQSIAAVAGAPWVSISRGCITSGCEKKTIVLDPLSLVRSASLSGVTVDVTTKGTRSYTITDLPAEVRVYDTSDRLHPAQIATRPNDVGAIAIGYSNGTVYAVADKVYAFSESGLTRSGEQLAAVTPATTARLLVDGGCATLSGRSAAAETYLFPQWTASTALPVPGSIRTLALGGGRLLILTDYSIEIWSRAAKVTPPKRRGVR